MQERIDFQQRQANGVAHVHIGTPRDQSASEGVETHGEDSWSVTTDEESEAGEPEVSVPEETPGEGAATYPTGGSHPSRNAVHDEVLVLCLNNERGSPEIHDHFGTR